MTVTVKKNSFFTYLTSHFVFLFRFFFRLIEKEEERKPKKDENLSSKQVNHNKTIKIECIKVLKNKPAISFNIMQFSFFRFATQLSKLSFSDTLSFEKKK